MRVGAVYPQIELGGDPGAVKAFAQATEDMGFDHLILYDHVFTGHPSWPVWEKRRETFAGSTTAMSHVTID